MCGIGNDDDDDDDAGAQRIESEKGCDATRCCKNIDEIRLAIRAKMFKGFYDWWMEKRERSHYLCVYR